MTGAAADTRPEHGAAGAAAPEPRAEPPVGATVAVAVLLAVACFATLLPLMLIVNRPTPLPAPFEPQNQDAETLLYLLAYLAILPASLIAGRRLAGRTDTATVALLAGVLGGLVGAVKLSGAIGGPDGVRTVLAAMVAWWLLAGVAFVRPPRLPPHAATAVAAAGIGAGVLALTDLDSVSATALVLGAIAAAAAVAAYGRVRVPRLAGPWATALKVAVVALLLLAVPNVVIFRPEDRRAAVRSRSTRRSCAFTRTSSSAPRTRCSAARRARRHRLAVRRQLRLPDRRLVGVPRDRLRQLRSARRGPDRRFASPAATRSCGWAALPA